MKSGNRVLPLQADLQDVLTRFLQLSAKFPCLSNNHSKINRLT